MTPSYRVPPTSAARDELNLVEAGSNYGWPEVSNGSDYGGGEIPDHAEGDGFAAADGTEVFDLGERVRAVEEGPDGAIWLLEDEGAGRLLRLTPASGG